MNSEKLNKEFLAAYDKYSEAIFKHCYFRIMNYELAKDLMQDTFMKTWQYLIDGKVIENMRAFLYRLANNLIIDFVRKKKEVSLEAMSEDGFEPSNSYEEQIKNNIELKEILKVVKKLAPDFRKIMIMRYVDDLSVKEIAKIIGISENLVSVRINRALKQIRNFLKND